MTILATALDWHAHGYTPLPTKADGSKAPAVTWKQHQGEQADEQHVRRWFASDPDGLGLVTGAAGLEMFELEGRAVTEGLLDDLARLMADNGYGDLWQRINSGYLEITPSGGFHWLYRVPTPRPNTKIARRPATPDELATHQRAERTKAEQIEDAGQRAARLARVDAMTVDRLPQVLIETRGEGGFTVVAPSAGRTHPTGSPWVSIKGGPATVPDITDDERDALYAIANMLDRMPTTEPEATSGGTSVDGVRPGDDFNGKATWDDILVPHGWQRVKKIGAGWGWVRPGKDKRDGISATTGTSADGVDRLYVFSTSTEFETERPYSKFAAHTLLEHDGDFTAAARQLGSAGYGEEKHRPVGNIADLIGTSGNLATVTKLEPRPALAVVPEHTLAHSDDANALSLVDRYGHILRHCSDRGRWYAWDGHVWAECPRAAGPAREYAKRIARALPENDRKDVDHKKRSLSAIGISAMLTQAASDSRVSVPYTALDAHPWDLNTPGGIVDLRTGILGPSDPTRLHTRSTLCTPDFDADRTVWLKFLDTTFNGDRQLIDYLQRLVGYSAVGEVHAHVLPYCHGSGGNGKGVFLEACVKVLGGYATTAPAGFLMAKMNPGHETEVARLAGARMVLCSEVNDDDRFDEARVKLLTGGDTLTARFMQQDHFTFTPTHHLWAMGNHQPHVRAGGRAFWRRLRLIPFLHEVPAEDVIDDLQGIIASQHGAAVLAWIVEGAVAYHRHGLQEPDVVKAATGEYAHDQDTVTRFLDEMCRIGGGEYVTIKVGIVRSAYENWCAETGDEPVSAKAFGMALRRHGIESKRTKTARMYVGLAMLGDEENASPSDDGWSR